MILLLICQDDKRRDFSFGLSIHLDSAYIIGKKRRQRITRVALWESYFPRKGERRLQLLVLISVLILSLYILI